MSAIAPPPFTAPGVRGPTIQLSTGRYFNFEKPAALTVWEVANALSKQCRFTGQSRRFYSVAQHAVLVSRLVPPEFAWEGLHHDDGEAVVGDMASPLKHLLPEYKAIEKRCEKPILAGFGIDAENMPPAVKRADMVARRTEQRDLMHPSGELWTNMEGVEPDVRRIWPMPSFIAKWMFLYRHWQLTRQRARSAA